MAHETIDAAALDQLFREARTQNKWQDRPVPDAKLHELYELLKFGPTSANASPARFVFVRTPEGKAIAAASRTGQSLSLPMTSPTTALIR